LAHLGTNKTYTSQGNEMVRALSLLDGPVR